MIYSRIRGILRASVSEDLLVLAENWILDQYILYNGGHTVAGLYILLYLLYHVETRISL